MRPVAPQGPAALALDACAMLSIWSRPLLEERDPHKNYKLLLFGGTVAFFNGVGLAHVFALLGFAVITRTFLVIDVTIAIDPYHSVATARCRCSVNLR